MKPEKKLLFPSSRFMYTLKRNVIPGFFLLSFYNVFLSVPISHAINLDYSVENTNIASYKQESRFNDFNRLRLSGWFDDDIIPDLTAVFIIDNRSLITQEDEEFDNTFTLHRGYIEYSTAKHLLVLGRQRIPFGVGRIWNPIDTFNPIDSTSIEPEEREGVDALRYEYAITDLSNIDLTIASEKTAARLKGFLDVADLALIAVINNDDDQVIVGWEVEGELFQTGIDIRSEGGSFYDQSAKKYHTELILGAEYGFTNSLTLLLEYYYNDDSANSHLGMSLSYQLGSLLLLNMLSIINIDDQSTLLAPTLSYSLGDESTLTGGAFFYNGGRDDGFGDGEDMIFIKWFVHF